MHRPDLLTRARDRTTPWDLVVIGGGATGAGIAVDAAARGYSTLLVERGDFGVGTSSRSTKLIHGGVRYLRQGNVRLVLDALHERGRLRRNAPHLVHDLAFVLPCYSRWEPYYYGLGLTAYDLLAGRRRFGRSQIVSAADVRRLLPTVQANGLRGGVMYHDGQFDDARLNLNLIQTAVELGAVALNYAPAVGVTRGSGRVDGVIVRDSESGLEWRAAARVVVNAAGPFCDDVRRLADPVTKPLVAASQGSHVVLNRSFLPGDTALLVPETPDKRVLFAIPWHGHTLVGTTDVEVPFAAAEPRPTVAEIDFILETASRYLTRQPQRSDVLSTFAGIRPLVKAGGGRTAALSRDHTIRVDAPGLITITGGKWTTYRRMAEESVDRAAVLAGLPRRRCRTRDLPIHGHDLDANRSGELAGYGSDAQAIRAIIEGDVSLGERLHPRLTVHRGRGGVGGAPKWRTVADVLARRLRALFLNAAAAVEMCSPVASLMSRELGKDAAWAADQVRAFTELAAGYRVSDCGPAS